MNSRQLCTGIAASLALAAITLTSLASTASSTASAAPSPTFLGRLHAVSQVASTVPANGDVNPYGVAVVSTTIGNLTAGDSLVSNFNSKSNIQGTGTTIVEISPTGASRLFAKVAHLPSGDSCPSGIGLSTALGILPGGWVVVGSLPTAKGGDLPAQDPAGCLIVLNSEGEVAETFTNEDIIAPWDLALKVDANSAELFVSNALGGNTTTENGLPVAGNCTVVRLDLALNSTAAPTLTSSTVIGKDYPWRANKAALILAPTGLSLGASGTLYVDDTQTNSISAITHAVTRTEAVAASTTTISSGGALNAPLGMTLAPNGDLIVVNGNNGNAVEVSPAGKQLATKTLVKKGAGDLFGLTTTPTGEGILLVNDGTNALDLYHD